MAERTAEELRVDDAGRKAAMAELLLEAARYLGETLEPQRVYARFHELLADSIHHDGVVVSDYDEGDGLIRCEYVWVDGNHVDPATLPPVPFNPEGGMQSRVIATGEPLLANDVRERVAQGGTYYDVEGDGSMRKVPDTGPPETRAAMMVPIKHQGRVVGVVQLMSDGEPYTDEHLELIEGLVAQMAAAARNARLHKAAELETAARVSAEAVAAEREQAANVLEAIGDGVMLVDADGVVRLWNRAAELITGRPAARACERRLVDVLPGWAAVEDRIPVGEGGSAVTLPFELDGAELWLSFVAVRSAEGVVYAFRDLTTERRLEEAKSEFIATISHELRTPMAGIYGAAQTLLREDVEFSRADQRTLLQIITTQAIRLAQITEEVLLAGRLDSGELPVHKERVDAAAVAAEALEAMRSRVRPETTLELEVAPGVHAAVGDRDRLQQVLLNLLDNAVKYSPEGGRVVLRVGNDGSSVQLAVADEGLGIPVAEQERVFAKFYRLDTVVTRAGGGTGLGLYITRELVRRMGGSIDVRSEPGAGSTFTVRLPGAE
jgi:two-component system, OmpR family, phosphate regulon sensor histidine kinase PhoR